ncbi:MAG: hypothetical protein H0T62_07110 [Parachlamydiaceae bacterium]|nr:hypothetical protein [Parachlamydiaceae bacterium]
MNDGTKEWHDHGSSMSMRLPMKPQVLTLARIDKGDFHPVYDREVLFKNGVGRKDFLNLSFLSQDFRSEKSYLLTIAMSI